MTAKHKQNLVLHPWRDGVQLCIKALEAAPDTNVISLVWNPEDNVNQQFLSNDLLASLLEFIGNELYDLDTMSIHFKDPAPRWSSALVTPPISAITTLMASNENIRSLTLVGLQLLGDDCLDMNGFHETIRIHPTLQCLVVRKCSFAKAAHLNKLKNVAYQRKRNERWSWKHLDISENVVVHGADTILEQATQQSKPTVFSWEFPLLSWCLNPITCCV
jgi:hypothetical protein